MSITPTRKVGSSSSSNMSRMQASANNRSEFVEVIDTNNNVLVKDEENSHGQNQNFSQEQEEKQNNSSLVAASPLVGGGVDAMVLSEDDSLEHYNVQQNVEIYDNNQSIIYKDNSDITNKNSLKHFYETNEPLVDFDKLV